MQNTISPVTRSALGVLIVIRRSSLFPYKINVLLHHLAAFRPALSGSFQTAQSHYPVDLRQSSAAGVTGNLIAQKYYRGVHIS